MHTSETRLRVRYAETDQMGVVYYANYFVWMEVARVDYCRSIGFSYQQMEVDDGVLLAVVEAHCRYVCPARYDQEVIVATTVPEAHPRMIRFAYQMRSAADGRALASGETRHVFCNREMKPARLPAKYRGLFGLY
jgi:acyl-CoA thioester hydrolase